MTNGLFKLDRIRALYGARGNALGHELALAYNGLNKHRFS
jgi:hypothetical protein